MFCFNVGKPKRLQYLTPEEQILYLIYLNEKYDMLLLSEHIYIDRDNRLYKNFNYIQCIKNLIASKVIKKNKDFLVINNIQMHYFLKTIDFFKQLSLPMIRSDIRNILKYKELNLALDRLLYARIISIFRVIGRNGDFLYYTDCYNEKNYNNFFKDSLLKFLNGDKYLAEIIFCIWNEEGISPDWDKKTIYTNDEKKIINFMRGLEKTHERKTALEIIVASFGKKTVKGKEAMLSLIKKHKVSGNVNNSQVWLK